MSGGADACQSAGTGASVNVAAGPSRLGIGAARARRLVRGRVVFLSAGALSAQLVVLLAAPLLTRLYSPSQFGVYGVATAAIAIGAALVTLQYVAAIPLPGSDRDAAALAATAGSISVGVGALAGVLIGVVAALVEPATTGARLALGVCVGIAVAATGLYQIATALGTRHADVRTIAAARLAQSGGVAAGQLGLGALGVQFGLLAGDAVGRTLGLLGTIRVWRRWLPLVGANWRTLGPAIRYRRFPLASGPAALLNAVTLQAPVMAVVAIYGTSSAGQYLLVQRIAAVPLAIVSVSVAQDLLVSVVEAGDTGRRELGRRTSSMQRALLIGGAPLIGLAALLSPVLFPVVLGADWGTAGLLFTISAPLYVAQLVGSPLGAVYDLLERQDLHMVRELSRGVLMAAAVGVLAALRPSLLVAALVLMVAGVAGYAVYHLLAWRAIVEAGRAHRQMSTAASLADVGLEP